MLVFDMGRNRGDAIIPLLQRVQHIVICIRSERAAISAARQIVSISRQLPAPKRCISSCSRAITAPR